MCVTEDIFKHIPVKFSETCNLLGLKFSGHLVPNGVSCVRVRLATRQMTDSLPKREKKGCKQKRLMDWKRKLNLT